MPRDSPRTRSRWPIENAVVHGVADAIDFAHGDLTEWPPTAQPVDLLLANLPYIPTDAVPTLPSRGQLRARDLRSTAVADGLDLIRRLMAQLPRVLTQAGIALLEIGSDQADAAARGRCRRWATAGRSTVHDDLAGRPRVVEIATECRHDGAMVLAASTRRASMPQSLPSTAGELIGIPTETVYGVCALPRHESVERLIAAKQRSSEKGIQLLVDSLDQVQIPGHRHARRRAARRTVLAGWTDHRPRASPGHRSDAAARRRPAHAGPAPARSRRATRAGASPRADRGQLGERLRPAGRDDAALVEQALGDVLELILDDGPVRGGTPSTVVDCSDRQPCRARVLREGAISAGDIAAATALRAKLAAP